jgi:hypothetical protein
MFTASQKIWLRRESNPGPQELQSGTLTTVIITLEYYLQCHYSETAGRWTKPSIKLFLRGACDVVISILESDQAFSSTIVVQFDCVQTGLGVHPVCYPQETRPFLREQRGEALKVFRHLHLDLGVRIREDNPVPSRGVVLNKTPT